MSKDTVTIGCRLPNGIKLEIGYEATATMGDGRVVTQVRQMPDYAAFTFKGWNAHVAEARAAGILMPAGTNTKHYLNRNVPRAFWERWKKDHPGSWLIKNNILFEADSEAAAQGKVIDLASETAPFLPLDPKKSAIPGIKVADFVEGKQATVDDEGAEE